eukprot:4417066-Pleurochrysis_carterae.AAC.2
MVACKALKWSIPLLMATETAAALPGRNVALPFTAHMAKRGGNLLWTMRLHGGARGMDTAEIAELLADPSKVAEAMEMMKDPETMAEIRELMDDPEFRGLLCVLCTWTVHDASREQPLHLRAIRSATLQSVTHERIRSITIPGNGFILTRWPLCRHGDREPCRWR